MVYAMLVEVLLKVAAIEAEENEQEYRPRPSAAGPERCLRQLVYFARGVPKEPMLDRMALVFDDGHVNEGTTAKWIGKTAFRLHHQQLRVKVGTVTHNGQLYDIEGSIDGLVSDFLGITTWLWEHKAINRYTFEDYWTGKKLPLDYITQCGCYLFGLAAAGWPQVTQALLVIKCKDTSDYIEFRLEYDRDADAIRILEVVRASTAERRYDVVNQNTVLTGVRRQALERFELVEQYRVTQTLPDRPFVEPQKFPCGRCQYQQRCWDGWVPPKLDGRIDLSAQDAAMVLEFERISNEFYQIKRRREELSDQIKLFLRANRAKEGLAGDKLVRLEQRPQSRVDPELLPPEIRKSATREVLQEFPKVLPAPHTILRRADTKE
ncbi:MAG: hypothetical protein AB1411_02440 [Nitrospirota bacterium]